MRQWQSTLKELEREVLVNNGETVVLGGIFQHSVSSTVDKVPLLGDLPVLGALFRRSYENVGKK